MIPPGVLAGFWPLNWPRSFCTALLFLAALPPLVAKDDWPAIPPAELAATASPLDPEAPAEILERRVEIDDRDFPEGRTQNSYIRYKVYAPEKSDSYTRIAVDGGESIGGVLRDQTFAARLTLPDGSVRLFTEKDLKEREVVRRAQDWFSRAIGDRSGKIRERFLAVTGVLPGSILEYRTSSSINVAIGYVQIVRDGTSSISINLQHPNLPCRKVEFIYWNPKVIRYSSQVFTLNHAIGASKQKEEKKRTLITATSLTPDLREPYAGLSAENALSVIVCIADTDRTVALRSIDRRVTANPGIDGAWSPIAARTFLIFLDRSEVTTRIKQRAAELTASAQAPMDKARAIYTYVQKALTTYGRKPQPDSENIRYVKSINDILTQIEKPDSGYLLSAEDFLHLSNALFKAGGFETRGVRLPARDSFLFNRSLVTEDALPHWAIQVKVDGQWVFAMPHYCHLGDLKRHLVLPFGSLPWQCEGLDGLVAKEGREEFAMVVNSKSAFSRTVNTVTLTLEPDGSVNGTATRKFTGHRATGIRERLLTKNEKEIKRSLRELLQSGFSDLGIGPNPQDEPEASGDKSADTSLAPTARPSVRVTEVTGLEDPNAPVVVSYSFGIPNYALVTQERIVIRPNVCRANAKTPFTSATRKAHIRWPFTYQEVDDLTWKLPEGYTLEGAVLPTVKQVGSVFLHRHTLTEDSQARTLNYRREFLTEAFFLTADKYPKIKEWFEAVDHADQQEIVLRNTSAAPVPAPTGAPAPAATN